MSSGAENVVQNIGAIAETTSIFYNSIIKQVPKDVALILTQHFMDITISKRPANPSAAAAIAAARAAEERRRAAAAEQNRRAPSPSDEGPASAAPKATEGPMTEVPDGPKSPDRQEPGNLEDPAGPATEGQQAD